MSEIIREMALIQLPQELLQQVDVNNLLINFRTNFNKLDEFKKIRDQHESRSAGKKIWDWIRRDDTIETAQLDAVEVQADFSKAIGQLMVLSIMQAQHLDRQQQQLSAQQITIKTQTTSIEEHNTILANQHEDLAKQNVELKKLVEDFFELRGLTQEGAKKLIAIAHEVKDTGAQLSQSVKNSLSDALHQIGLTEAQINAELLKAMEFVSTTISDVQAELDEKINVQIVEVREQLALSDEKLNSIQRDMSIAQVDFDKRHGLVSAALVTLEDRHDAELKAASDSLLVMSARADKFEGNLYAHGEMLTRISGDLEAEQIFLVGVNKKLEVIANQFELHELNIKRKFARLHFMLGASIALTICLLGFIVWRM